MKNRKQMMGGMWICTGALFLLTFLMVKAEMGKGAEVLLYSDFATHSSWAVGELTDPVYDKFYEYPVWHMAVRAVSILLPIGREYAGAAVTACCIGLTAALLYRFLYEQLKGCVPVSRICLLDIGLMVLTALYMPWFNREVYLGQSSPTIWHNPTNMAVKPLAFLCFLLFIQEYESPDATKPRKWILMSALLLLSCFVKPSFIQGFLPAVIAFLLLELARTRGKSFGFSLKMAAAFVPSGLYFLYQFLAVFGEGSGRTIGIDPFAVMRLDTEHPLISILQSVAFPLFVLCILGWKRIWKDKTLLFSVIFYLVCLMEFILLIELTEAASGNFEWALQLAMFLLFVITAVRFYQTKWQKQWIPAVGSGLLLYHVLSGIYYYLGLLFWLPGQC